METDQVPPPLVSEVGANGILVHLDVNDEVKEETAHTRPASGPNLARCRNRISGGPLTSQIEKVAERTWSTWFRSSRSIIAYLAMVAQLSSVGLVPLLSLFLEIVSRSTGTAFLSLICECPSLQM
jgi:hypothetical protein